MWSVALGSGWLRVCITQVGKKVDYNWLDKVRAGAGEGQDTEPMRSYICEVRSERGPLQVK